MKKILKKASSFLKNTRGLVSPEYMIIALVVLAAAGVIGVGYVTHANTQAKTTTTQVDTSFTNAKTSATGLPQP